MVSETGLDLKTIIDVLRNGRTTDWALDEDKELQKEYGGLLRTKLEFKCTLTWQKVKLYEMEALEFLSFAKQDLQENSERGRVNVLSNAARAIGCRVDEILTLLNMVFFARGKNLPVKMLFLQNCGVTVPDVLREQITSKRNWLEHDYWKPKDPKEIKHIVEIAELFLKATDQYVEKGYIASATVQDIKWFPDYSDIIIGYVSEYKLIFDLDKEELTLKPSNLQCFLKSTKRGSKLPAERSTPVSDEESASIPIRDCAKEDVVELMILLREKER